LRTPLNGLLAVSELILVDSPPSDQNTELRQMFDQSRQRMVSLLDDALLLTEIDVREGGFKAGPIALQPILNRAIVRTAEFAHSRQVTIYPPSADLGLVQGEEDLLVRAVHAVLETAVKFSEESGSVRVSGLPNSIGFVIESRGWNIPRRAMAKFFDVFSIGEAIIPGGELGLAAPLATRIFSLFGGKLTAENLEPAGLQLAVSFEVRQRS
jgi:K+-sensing histidine kinase KdpD